MKKLLLAAVCLLTTSGAVVAAGESDSPKVGQWGKDEWTWTTEKWTGSERPYRQVRSAIDKQLAQGADPEALAQRYKAEAKPWMDPLKQYRWGYAAYEAARKVNFKGQARRLHDVEDALREAARMSPPRNALFARLRFLVSVRQTPWPELRKVGRRLVVRNPKDYEVRFFYVSVLDPDLSAQDEKLALSHANALIQALPKKPTVYSLMGGVYFKIWLRSNQNADADKAVSYYNKYLALAPKDHSFRKGAQGQINFIRRLQESRRKTARKAS